MDNLWPIMIVQGVGLVATVAAIKTSLKNHEERIKTLETRSVESSGFSLRLEKLEKHIDDLPTRFVPRSEVQLMLSSIRQVTEDTKALMQALVYGGGDRAVARKALEPKE